MPTEECTPLIPHSGDGIVTMPRLKNAGYHWKHILPGWISVLIALVIIITKHTLDEVEADVKISQDIMGALYPSAITHLIGVMGAGIGIDVVAVMRNGPWYYKEGHNAYHIDLLPDTSHDLTWALTWGVHASWVLSLIFSAIEAIPAIVFAALGTPLPFTHITYALLCATVVGVTGAYVYSERWAHNLRKNVYLALNTAPETRELNLTPELIDEHINLALKPHFQAIGGSLEYEVSLPRVPVEQRLNYLKSGRMTNFGYTFFSAVGVATLITSAVVGTLHQQSSLPRLE